MVRGFRGMKDDFMEIIHHIVGLSCCSFPHDDNYDGQLLPLPQPTGGDFVCLEASEVFSASNTEVRDAVAMEDDPRSTLAGTSLSFPQAEFAVIDGDQDPGFAAVRNTLGPNFESEDNFWTGYNASLNTKLYEHDSESVSSSQNNSRSLLKAYLGNAFYSWTQREKSSNPKISERNSSSRSLNFMVSSNAAEEEEGTSKERCFESASDVEDYYFYSKSEGEDFSMKKHILVEDHMPSISLSEGLQLRKRTNKNLDDEEIGGSHESDGSEYVIV